MNKSTAIKTQHDVVNGFPEASRDCLDVGVVQEADGNFVVLRLGKTKPGGEVIEELFYLPMDVAIELGSQIVFAGNSLYEIEKVKSSAKGGN